MLLRLTKLTVNSAVLFYMIFFAHYNSERPSRSVKSAA